MTDIRSCCMCNRTFDFDEEGFSYKEFLVCSIVCIKKRAIIINKDYAIYNPSGELVETNAPTIEIDDYLLVAEKVKGHHVN